MMGGKNYEKEVGRNPTFLVLLVSAIMKYWDTNILTMIHSFKWILI